MLDIETQTAMQPPKQPPNKKIATGFPDDIREIGERIANLTLLQAKELFDYLNCVYGITWPY